MEGRETLSVRGGAHRVRMLGALGGEGTEVHQKYSRNTAEIQQYSKLLERLKRRSGIKYGQCKGGDGEGRGGGKEAGVYEGREMQM